MLFQQSRSTRRPQWQMRTLTALGAVVCCIAGTACSSSEDAATTATIKSPESTASTSNTEAALDANTNLVRAAQAHDLPTFTPEIQQIYPFNTDSFTQGLEFDAATSSLLVGTGQYGESRVYRSTLSYHELASAALDPAFFGEGIALTSDTLWQLTWKAGVAIARDPATLAERHRVEYEGEGWGLCTLPAHGDTPERLVMSDGTATLRILDAATFEELQQVTVTLGDAPVQDLNELACVAQEDTPDDLGSSAVVFANVFMSTDIVRINIDTEADSPGNVTGVIDASALPNNAAADINNVLNGIAHIPGTNELFLTGKRWPDLYRVTLDPTD